MGLFIQKQERPSLIKDFLSSKRAERQWRRNRFRMKTAVNDFHKSMQGRRQHRRIGRFLATREQGSLKSGLFYPR